MQHKFHPTQPTLQVPEGWSWLQDVSFFYWGTIGMARDVLGEVSLKSQFSIDRRHRNNTPLPPSSYPPCLSLSLPQITYRCADDSVATFNAVGGTCDLNMLGVSIPCDAGISGGVCYSNGLTVMAIYKGIQNVDKWEAFGKLVGLMMGFRVLVLLLYMFPVWTLYCK